MQAEHTRERTALVEIKAQKDEAVNSCHSRIAALQGDIEAAIRQNNEARDSAARFSSVKCVLVGSVGCFCLLRTSLLQ
jgi:hypothetical protein